MKTQLTALMMRIALLALPAALPFQAAAQAQPPAGTADDLADVAGILAYHSSSRMGTLHVVPGEEQKVLEVLRAYPVEDQKFLVNAGGSPVLVRISPLLDRTLIHDLVSEDEQVWVYRNRICTEISPPQLVAYCQPDGKGQYTTLWQDANRVCRHTDLPVSSYCKEDRKAWSRRYVWKDDKCTILDHLDTEERFTCE